MNAATQDDALPDRLSLDPRSAFYDEAVLSRGVGIKFNGKEKTSVIEYCISEGWIRVAAGRSLDRYGQPMTIMLKGDVKPYFDGPASTEDGVVSGG
jgi:hypothetical protein